MNSWQNKNGALYRIFTFRDFTRAFDFMKAVAAVAEQMQHHPKWLNEWNKVEIWLSTHEAGGVTEKDRQLAKAIDTIYEKKDK